MCSLMGWIKFSISPENIAYFPEISWYICLGEFFSVQSVSPGDCRLV